MNAPLDRFDRRSTSRASRTVGARILNAEGLAVAASTVCNISSTGALVRTGDCTGMEHGFYLLIDGETSVRRCLVAWRSGNQIGVRFIRREASGAVIAADLLSREAMFAGWNG